MQDRTRPSKITTSCACYSHMRIVIAGPKPLQSVLNEAAFYSSTCARGKECWALRLKATDIVNMRKD